MSCRVMDGGLGMLPKPILVGFGVLAAAGAVVYSCGPNILVGAVKVPQYALAARAHRAALAQLDEQIDQASEAGEIDRLKGMKRQLENEIAAEDLNVRIYARGMVPIIGAFLALTTK